MSAPHGVVQVQHDKHLITLPLPPPSSPLSALKDSIYNKTGVAPNQQKLVMNGKILRDDLATLAQFGLVENPDEGDGGASSGKGGFWRSWGLSSSKKKPLKLHLIGNTGPSISERPIPVSAPPPPKEPETEESVLKRLDEILASVRTNFVQQIDELCQSPPPGSEGFEESTRKKQAMLSEVVLQALLKLDSVDLESEWTEARKKRKEGVKEVQGLLDRIDGWKEGTREESKKTEEKL